MKRLTFLALAGSALILTSSLFAAAKLSLDGVKCPISGKAAKDGTEVAHNGGKVFFCCQNCPKKFQEETAKFAAKANFQLVATGQAKEVKCPIKGKKLNPATAIDVAGTEICFCCPGCKKKALATTGDEQIELIFNQEAFAKAFKVRKGKKSRQK